MIVVIAEDVPPAIRGMLKRWFVEPRANVFVGSLNARTRDKAMDYIRRNACGIRMLTIEDAPNCQGYEIKSYGDPSRRSVAKSGLHLIIENGVDTYSVGMRSRIISEKLSKALFLDIETDGMGAHAQITTIATVMNGCGRVFVRGTDLMDFRTLWDSAEVVVSFNGKRFDVPIIMREFGITQVPSHVDLMEEGRCHGLNGGLKEIEKQIGYVRAQSDCGNGMDAIAMWRRYAHDGDAVALQMLKQYNLEDVKSLVALYHHLISIMPNWVESSNHSE